MAERIQKGLPVEPERIRDLVHEAKLHKRASKDRKGKQEARNTRKRREARLDREFRKQEEDRQRKEAAAIAVAREVAGILTNKLDEDEITKVNAALDDFRVTRMLRDALAIIEPAK